MATGPVKPITRRFGSCHKTTSKLVALLGYLAKPQGLVLLCVLPPQAYPRIPIGKLSPNLEAFIVDPETKQPVKPQLMGTVDGELWIGGPAIAQGYLNNPTMTASRFVDAPSGHKGSGGKYFATGDMVRLDSEGVLIHMGRVDDQINLGGLRIEPGEVENAIIHAARARGIPTDKVVVVARDLELCACISPPIPQDA